MGVYDPNCTEYCSQINKIVVCNQLETQRCCLLFRKQFYNIILEKRVGGTRIFGFKCIFAILLYKTRYLTGKRLEQVARF